VTIAATSLFAQLILIPALNETSRAVDEDHAVAAGGGLGGSEDKQTGWDHGRVEEVRRKADHGLQEVLLYEALTDSLFDAPSEQNSVGHNGAFEVNRDVVTVRLL
jgi:hypothetical protein